jgi:hypothetical protein
MHAKDLKKIESRAAFRQGPTLHITTRRNGIVRLWKTPNNGRTFGVLDAKFDAVVAVKEGGTQRVLAGQRASWAYILAR